MLEFTSFQSWYRRFHITKNLLNTKHNNFLNNCYRTWTYVFRQSEINISLCEKRRYETYHIFSDVKYLLFTSVLSHYLRFLLIIYTGRLISSTWEQSGTSGCPIVRLSMISSQVICLCPETPRKIYSAFMICSSPSKSIFNRLMPAVVNNILMFCKVIIFCLLWNKSLHSYCKPSGFFWAWLRWLWLFEEYAEW